MVPLAVLLAVLLAPAGAASAAPRAAGTAGSPAPKSSRVTFGIQPATTGGVAARPYFSFGVTPGARLADHVALVNYSTRATTLQVYATDAANNADGGFTLLPGGAKPTDAGSWLRLGIKGDTVRVPARTGKGPGVVVLPVALSVPLDASPGDHAAGIVASLNTVSKRAGAPNLHFDQRVATRVYVRVAGTLTPRLSVAGLKVTYRGTVNPVGRGDVDATYTVRNTGNVKLAARQAVAVGGLLGTVHATGPADVALLLPGGSESVTAVVHGVAPTFLRTATVTLEPLTPTGDIDPTVPPASSSTHFWAIPWTLLALIAAVVVATVLEVRRRRRLRSSRRARRGSPTPPPTSRHRAGVGS